MENTEELDIDIDEATILNARYVVFQLYNYTGIPFSEMPHAMFGWMEREDSQAGQIFEPKTVKQKMDLTFFSLFVRCSLPCSPTHTRSALHSQGT